MNAPSELLKALPVLDWPAFCDQLQEGALVFTANKRLARALLERYARWQRSQGRPVWPRAEILPWLSWCQQQLLAEFDERAPHLLSRAQSERVWRAVIEAAPALNMNVPPARCVQPVADAWELLRAHGLGSDLLRTQHDNEAETLAGWIEDYQQRLQQMNALDQAAVSGWVAQSYAVQNRVPPPRLIVAGFFELPLELQRLLQSMRVGGCELLQLALPRRQSLPQLLAGQDEEDETRAAARWARARLMANPEARIAVVVLDLSERRARLERIMDEVLSPHTAYQVHSSGVAPYDISLGTALADEPIVADALLALRWALEPLDFSAVSQLLRSPFFAHDRAVTYLELRLRQLNLAQPSLDQVLYQAGGQHPQRWRSAAFVSRWRQFRAALRASGVDGPLSWAECIGSALDRLGWGGGDRRLSSREYQALHAFQATLEQLATLQSVWPRCTAGQALDELQQLARAQIFQIQRPSVPILITEPLQALGMAFDHLWVMGASDDLWPPVPRPNPLIPYALQRQYDLPHATAAGELRYAQALTRVLLASADEVICSWPVLSGDKTLRPSPLLARADVTPPAALVWLQEQGLAAAPAVEPVLVDGAGTGIMETYSDDWAPPLDAAQVRGGAGVVTEQSACPFRALATYRWRLKPAAVPTIGLTPEQRGSLLHRALQALYELSEGILPASSARAEIVQQATLTALEYGRSRWPDLREPRLSEREQVRLSTALEEWIDLDEQRPVPFKAVVLETPRELVLGPLQLSLRMDRLDHLTDGRYVLIDYKGGASHQPGEWLGARPAQPQLPLYALAISAEHELAALAFGNLKTGQRRYTGLAQNGELISGLQVFTDWTPAPAVNWPGLLDHWRHQLTMLAQQYAAGDAAVDPREPGVCRYCRLAPLCRIDSHNAGASRQEEAGDDR